MGFAVPSGFGKVEGVEPPAGEDGARDDVIERVLDEPGAGALGVAHEENLEEDEADERAVVRRGEGLVQVGD